MVPVELIVIAGVAVAFGMLTVADRLGGRTDRSDQEAEFADWRTADAEVVSMLRASDHTFLLVRFWVGTSLIQNDVRYPLGGAAPHAGQRVPIRYEPANPARLVFDQHPSSRPTPELAG